MLQIDYDIDDFIDYCEVKKLSKKTLKTWTDIYFWKQFGILKLVKIDIIYIKWYNISVSCTKEVVRYE